jgi:flagellar assembly protein FliH
MPSSEFVPLAEEATSPAAAFRLFDPDTSPPLPATAVPLHADAQAPNLAEARAEAAAQEAQRIAYEEERAALLAQLESVGQSFVASLEEVARFRREITARYERELLELSLGIARKIVQREVAERPELWLGMLRTAVRHAVDRERIVVRVPATVAAFLREQTTSLRAALDGVKEVEVVEDTALADGACILESHFGEVDLGIDTQLEAVARALGPAPE